MAYAPITWATVVLLARDVPTVPVATQDLILSLVEETVAPDEFGGVDATTYIFARAYLAAHYAVLWLRSASGPAGVTTSMSENGVSIGFSGFQWNQSLFGETPYGRALLSLIGPSVAGFVT